MYVQVTGKVVVHLSSPAITALPGSVSRSKHIGYTLINIAHVPVEGFERALPGFRVFVKKKLKFDRLGLTGSQLF